MTAVRSERRVAIVVGALYILATVAGLLAAAALGSSLQGPGVLLVSPHRTLEYWRRRSSSWSWRWQSPVSHSCSIPS
jgi:hypothetical protein